MNSGRIRIRMGKRRSSPLNTLAIAAGVSLSATGLAQPTKRSGLSEVGEIVLAAASVVPPWHARCTSRDLPDFRRSEVEPTAELLSEIGLQSLKDKVILMLATADREVAAGSIGHSDKRVLAANNLLVTDAERLREAPSSCDVFIGLSYPVMRSDLAIVSTRFTTRYSGPGTGGLHKSLILLRKTHLGWVAVLQSDGYILVV